ncbi:MAG: sensor histidine kinase [Chloroflexota bacterium]|nr:sensor histidine kinase [Chloroflexota bacterium]
MKAIARLRRRRLTPAQRFLLTSFGILVVGMATVGAWVTRQIEDGVVQRTAATTALYVDSLIAAPVADLADAESLSPEAVKRLNWLLDDTPLGQEVTLFQIWDRDGRIVYSTVDELVGERFPVDDELRRSFAGEVTAHIGEAEGMGSLPIEVSQFDLIEIYSPVRGEGGENVIAVAEFYYSTNDLDNDLAAAQRRSWMVVGGATLMIYLLLATFVGRASNTIQQQQQELGAQVTRLTTLLRQNRELSQRVRGAAARTAALNERFLRRFSAELHDGPAQEISLALLRLDHVAERSGENGRGVATRTEIGHELELIQASLRRSLQEVRQTSSGLLLPHLGGLTVAETIDHVVRGHQRRTGATVKLTLGELPEQAQLANKIALYRIIQEALGNAWRHAGGKGLAVAIERRGDALRVEVSDDGPGFEPAIVEGSADHLGLVGMRERVESLGGEFQIESAPGRGTRVIATLPETATGELDG